MRPAIRCYRDLEVWQRSVDLFVQVTSLVRTLPLSDRFVFETQIRRAARSVAANLGEGHERRHLGDYLRHVSFSRGSLAEVETDLTLIDRTTAASKSDIAACNRTSGEVGRMLTNLHGSLKGRR